VRAHSSIVRAAMNTPAFRVLAGIVLLASALHLASCAQTAKYPIYMQDRPAIEAALPPELETPSPDPEPAPVTTGLGNQGSITSSELPPPPPPPPAEVMAPPKASTIKPAEAKPSTDRPSVPKASVSTKPVAVPAPIRETIITYVYGLQPNDTLFGVARRFGVPITTIYKLNNLSETSVTKPNQKIRLPSTAVDKGVQDRASGPKMEKVTTVRIINPPAPKAVPVPKPAPKPVVTTPEVTAPKPVVTPKVSAPEPTVPSSPVAIPTPKPVVTAPVTTKPSTPSAPKPQRPALQANGFPTASAIAKLGKGRFVWPFKGPIVARYGQLGPNVRNDGINIGGPEGAEIVSASEGTIVYVGDQVKELGLTIYIRHEDGFYTGYSHMAKVSVKPNQKVSQGQVIGTMGKSGSVERPQLHFEVRYTPSSEIAKPIDPTLVLP
jgi:murein DD-endopeptidase MepM/ murein hydrolase activator NlpD